MTLVLLFRSMDVFGNSLKWWLCDKDLKLKWFHDIINLFTSILAWVFRIIWIFSAYRQVTDISPASQPATFTSPFGGLASPYISFNSSFLLKETELLQRKGNDISQLCGTQKSKHHFYNYEKMPGRKRLGWFTSYGPLYLVSYSAYSCHVASTNHQAFRKAMK